MSIGRSGRQAAAYAGMYYESTPVLVNKIGIRDLSQLEEAERSFNGFHIKQGLPPDARALTYQGSRRFIAIFSKIFMSGPAKSGVVLLATSSPFAPPEQFRRRRP